MLPGACVAPAVADVVTATSLQPCPFKRFKTSLAARCQRAFGKRVPACGGPDTSGLQGAPPSACTPAGRAAVADAAVASTVTMKLRICGVVETAELPAAAPRLFVGSPESLRSIPVGAAGLSPTDGGAARFLSKRTPQLLLTATPGAGDSVLVCVVAPTTHQVLMFSPLGRDGAPGAPGSSAKHRPGVQLRHSKMYRLRVGDLLKIAAFELQLLEVQTDVEAAPFSPSVCRCDAAATLAACACAYSRRSSAGGAAGRVIASLSSSGSSVSLHDDRSVSAGAASDAARAVATLASPSDDAAESRAEGNSTQ
jgi:hypothetical protein